jgi:hypothetical protein
VASERLLREGGVSRRGNFLFIQYSIQDYGCTCFYHGLD